MEPSPLVVILLQLAAGVGVMLVVAAFALVGRKRLREAATDARARFRAAAPYLAGLGGVLLANKVARGVVPSVSWLVGVNITGTIYAVEGNLVVAVQSIATPTLTAYFAFIYLFGYVFLLTFPFVAYFALPDLRPLKLTAVAYAFNYGGGLCLYVVFIAYGPRNLLPDLITPLLYETYPRTQILTSAVNVNTNVFPSLHTSLSVTTAAFAWRTRETYPEWTVVASVLAISVAVSTMYLGIHWVTDVVFGIGLGLFSVIVATRYVDGDVTVVHLLRKASGLARP